MSAPIDPIREALQVVAWTYVHTLNTGKPFRIWQESAPREREAEALCRLSDAEAAIDAVTKAKDAEIEALKADAERYRWLKAHGYYDHAEDVARIDEQIALAQCQNCLGTRAPNALDPEWKGRCECAEAAEQAEQHEEINGRPAPDAALKEPS